MRSRRSPPSEPAQYQTWSAMTTPAVPSAMTTTALVSPAAAKAPAAASTIRPGNGIAVASMSEDRNTTA